MDDFFYKKTAIIIQSLAADLLQLKLNDRLESVSTYQTKYNVSRGTVQNAFNYLKEQHAITILNRGALGSFIKNIDYAILQKYALPETILGTMTLPYTKLYEGLASALYHVFEKNEIRLNLAYLRGAKERINSIKQKTYRFAIVSRYAANESIKKGTPIDVIVDLGEQTYLDKHVILFSNKNSREICDGMTLGIDHNSIDQQFLTKKLIANKKVTLIEISSHKIIDALNSGVIDAGVWNYDEIKNQRGLFTYITPKRDQDIIDMSTAVIICHRDDHAIKTIFEKTLSKIAIIDFQKQVVDGDIIPKY